MPDANIEACVNRIIWGKFMNAGQTCIAPDYVLLVGDVDVEVFVQKCLEVLRRMYGEDPSKSPGLLPHRQSETQGSIDRADEGDGEFECGNVTGSFHGPDGTGESSLRIILACGRKYSVPCCPSCRSRTLRRL